jgi:hypothetical protein
MAECPIQIARHSVQGDGLIQQLVTRGALHLNCEMVPRIAVGVARDTCGGPMRTLVIPNVPLMAAWTLYSLQAETVISVLGSTTPSPDFGSAISSSPASTSLPITGCGNPKAKIEH